MSVNTNQFIQGVGGMVTDAIGGTVGNVESSIDRAATTARSLGIDIAQDSTSGIGGIISKLKGWLQSFFTWITGLFDQSGSAARSMVEPVLSAGASQITAIGTGLGLTNDTAAGEIVENSVKGFMRSIPALGEGGSQDATKTKILELRTQLTEHYVGVLARQYPEAVRANAASVETAAERIAGLIVGYPELPNTSNNTMLLSAMGEPAAGSIGALMLAGQLRAKGSNSENVTASAINFRSADIAAIRASLGAAPAAAAAPNAEPTPAQIAAAQVIIDANKAKGANAAIFIHNPELDSKVADNRITADELAGYLVRSGLEISEGNVANLQMPPSSAAAPRRS